MKPGEQPCCGSCAAFFRNRVNLTTPQVGECHRRPPTVVMLMLQTPPTIQAPQGQVQQQPAGFWPPTQANSLCMEWQEREGHPLFSGDGTMPLSEAG